MTRTSARRASAPPRKPSRWLAGTAAIALLAVAAAAVWQLLRPPFPAIDPADAAQVARGLAVYDEHCASCHGAQLEGQPDWRERLPTGRLPAPPHDATGHTWHHPDALLFGMTKHGLGPYAPEGYESDMPAFDGVLSDADIAAVLAYIKSAWPPEIRAQQDRINRQSR
jgi:mono/diheme cytochrome c family protein